MTPNEMRSSPGDKWLDLSYNALLDATHICDNRAALEMGQHLFRERAHLSDGRTEHDDVSTSDCPVEIEAHIISDACLAAIRDSRLTTDESANLPGQPTLF